MHDASQSLLDNRKEIQETEITSSFTKPSTAMKRFTRLAVTLEDSSGASVPRSSRLGYCCRFLKNGLASFGDCTAVVQCTHNEKDELPGRSSLPDVCRNRGIC